MGRIEIKGIVENSLLDWQGKVATVIFLPLCSFRCPFCHARDLVLHPQELETIPFERLRDVIRKNAGWIDGVVVCGGEPTVHDRIGEFIQSVRALGVGVKLDTNGSRPDVIKTLIDDKLIDYVAMDIKAPLEADAYNRACGVAVDLEAIKASITTLLAGEVDYEFRLTVCPAIHKEEDVRRIARYVGDARRLYLQDFQPGNCIDKELDTIKQFTPREMEGMLEAAKSACENAFLRNANN